MEPAARPAPAPDAGLISRARRFHPWDAMSPAALEAVARRGPFHSTAESGCGGSTILLSHLSARHVAFALDGVDGTVSELRRHPDLAASSVTFVEGYSPGMALPGSVGPCIARRSARLSAPAARIRAPGPESPAQRLAGGGRNPDPFGPRVVSFPGEGTRS
jgi:hypothetical protein